MIYRPEIDGLRAIAVVGVVLYHADLVWNGRAVLPGGYLGVDIFFVISGYLITSLLARDIANHEFSLLNFYERRARRILPALLLVMVVSAPFAWAIMSASALIEYAESVLATLLFSSNIFFWLQDSYAAEPSQLKPLLHTWSLALEEQFYIVFPIFLLVVLRFANRWLIVSLGFLIIASLGIATYLSTRHTDANFFLMPSRVWELLVGAVIALRFETLRNSVPITFQTVLPVLGLIVVVLSFFWFDDATPHPSLYTVLPVLGVAAMILWAKGDGLVGRWLSVRPVVLVGLVSYSFYLWHFPIFAFGRILAKGTETRLDLAIWIMLSLGLAYLSWRFVEQPFRRGQTVSAKKLVASAVLVSGALAVNAGVIAKEIVQGRNTGIPVALQEHFKAWRPSVDPGRRCIDSDTFLEPDTWCKLGIEREAGTDFLLVGDSHALAYASFFDAAAHRLGLYGKLVSRSGCPTLLDLEPFRGNPLSGQCLELGRKVIEHAVANGIKDVFFAVRWNYYTCGAPVPNCGYTQNVRVQDSAWPKNEEARLDALRVALKRTVAKYAKGGINLHIIAQAPHQPRTAQEIFTEYFGAVLWTDLVDLSVRYDDHRRFTRRALKLLTSVSRNQAHVQILDPAEVLCADTQSCPIGTNSASYYTDSNHLSPGAMKLMEPWVRQVLQDTVASSP